MRLFAGTAAEAVQTRDGTVITYGHGEALWLSGEFASLPCWACACGLSPCLSLKPIAGAGPRGYECTASIVTISDVGEQGARAQDHLDGYELDR